MADPEEAVCDFLEHAETIFEEYDQGYMDADAALRRLRVHVDDLKGEVG
jgi:hypothetical protein